jgi:hypothetical protein
MVVFLYVQTFMDKLPLNLVLLYNCSIVIGWLQNENVLQLLIIFFMFVPISWYNDILGCRPPLIEIFIYKIFFKHPPWYIKVPQVSKIVKLWQFFIYTVMCFHPWEYLFNESNRVCHNKMMGKQKGFLTITFHMYFILIIWCYL